MSDLPNIVLVHGAWADGSCWSTVIERLQARGYDVTAPQFPESSLADDVARLRQVLARQDGPTVVAGHSYGGQIMTAMGTDAPNAAALVYIAAFGLDEGESIGALLASGPPTPALANLDIDEHGLRMVAEGRFRQPLRRGRRPGGGQSHVRRSATALDVDAGRRDGRPGLEVTSVVVPRRRGGRGDPSGRRASFAERMGATTVEVPSSHVAMVSHPDDVVALIESAVKGLRSPHHAPESSD